MDSQTSHNAHAQRKEQKHQKHYFIRGKQMYHKHGGLKLNTATQSQPLQVTHTKAVKITDITPSETKNVSRRHPLLTSNLPKRASSCPSRQSPL